MPLSRDRERSVWNPFFFRRVHVPPPRKDFTLHTNTLTLRLLTRVQPPRLPLIRMSSYSESFYVILGVDADASPQEIKQAYKKA